MSRIAVRGVIENEGKFLLVRQKFNTTFWCLPGGGVEPGEDLFTALKRELVEETNVEPVIGNLLFIQQIRTSDGYDFPEFHFHVTNAEDYLRHDTVASTHGEKEIEEIDWIDVSQVTIKPEFLATRLPEVTKQNFDTKTEIHLTELT